ncbi:hypothetical protein EBF04_20065 [Streptomyces sp. I6]|nr:hypothetical protein EBF04_20065 [Streptomyces sp. I6]
MASTACRPSTAFVLPPTGAVRRAAHPARSVPSAAGDGSRASPGSGRSGALTADTAHDAPKARIHWIRAFGLQ